MFSVYLAVAIFVNKIYNERKKVQDGIKDSFAHMSLMSPDLGDALQGASLQDRKYQNGVFYPIKKLIREMDVEK